MLTANCYTGRKYFTRCRNTEFAGYRERRPRGWVIRPSPGLDIRLHLPNHFVYPDQEYVRNTLGKLEILLVQDIFLTETAKLANVVLPGASFAEKEGTFTNVEGRIQKLNKAFNPWADSKADGQIICLLAQAMGHEFEYGSPKDIFKELTGVSPIYSGMDWETLGLSRKQGKVK